MNKKTPSSKVSLWRLLGRAIPLWVGVIFLLVGLVATVGGIQTASTEQTYLSSGLTVDAKVLDKGIERAKRGEHSRTRYLVRYVFQSEQGQQVRSEAEVSVDEWESLEPGSDFRVLYLPDAPENNRAESDTEWIAALVFIVMGCIFTLIGGGLTYTELRSILQAVQLSKNGILTQATVLRAEPTNTMINRVPQWCVTYCYRDSLSQEHEGVSHLMSPEEGSSWQKGDIGAVRYDEHTPSTSVWMGK